MKLERVESLKKELVEKLNSLKPSTWYGQLKLIENVLMVIFLDDK